MTKIMKVLHSLKIDRRGVTALEYGLIAAVIAVVIIAGATRLGGTINTTFNSISSSMNSAPGVTTK